MATCPMAFYSPGASLASPVAKGPVNPCPQAQGMVGHLGPGHRGEVPVRLMDNSLPTDPDD